MLFVEEPCAQREGDDHGEAAEDAQDADLCVRHGDGVEEGPVREREEETDGGDGPSPLEFRLFVQERELLLESQGDEHQEHQVDGEVQLHAVGVQVHGVEEETVVEGAGGADEGGGDDHSDAAASPGEALQVSDVVEEVVSREDDCHAEQLREGGAFAEEADAAQGDPDRRGGADGRRDGNGQVV